MIIGIGDVDVTWSTHEEVVSLIKSSRNDLTLRLIQPVEKPSQPSRSMMKTMAKTLPGRGGVSPTSTTSSSSGVSSAASHLSSTLSGRGGGHGAHLASSKSCDRIHNIGIRQPGRRRDKSLDSHVKYRTDAKSSKGWIYSDNLHFV